MLVAVEDRESEEIAGGELGRLLVDDEAFLARLKPLYTADALDGIGKMRVSLRFLGLRSRSATPWYFFVRCNKTPVPG